MKGIVFNLLEAAVSREFGEEVWDGLLDAAGLDGAYTSLGSYDDAEVIRLVDAAAKALSLTPQEVLRWFGRSAMPLLAARYPDFFNGHADARSFLLTLNSIIHPEVRKLYPGAITPVFDFDTTSPEVLQIGYSSPRRLCALAEGFIQGAAKQFGQEAEVSQPQCVHRGDARCVFHVRFAGQSHETGR
jgi:hypothetical protein